MKKRVLIVQLLFMSFLLLSQNQMETKFEQADFFTNPIFTGDYPDPSLLVDGDDYYVVHSSFEYYPGLTIWHSKDLINWTPVKSTLNKYIGSVWAPDLVKCNDKYYIYFPANNTNYVIYADSINGNWSDPIDLKIGNIDPGHVVDDQGNRYLFFSSGAYAPLSKDGLSVIGELKHSYDGWPIPREWSIECFCMEGPKLFKKGDYYYLTVAEGGTAGPATGHMVISARSKSLSGPWENSPYNPIIRTQSSCERWWSVGHATVFEQCDGNWWMIFHGYEKDHYNMGRQTLLAPIEWTNDGWFKLPDDFDIEKPVKINTGNSIKSSYTLNDSFEENNLKLQWKFFGDYDTTRFSLAGEGIKIKGKDNSVSDCSPLLCMPMDHSYEAQVEIDVEGNAIGGLTLFYSKKIFSGILADHKNILANLRGWQFPTEENVINKHVYLKIRNINNVVDMYYSLNGLEWIKIRNSSEVSAFHHNVLSEFLSLRIGLVSIGEGFVIFRNFKYQPMD